MGTKTKALKALINKLEFNPVPLGGNSIYTTKIGIVLGAMVMIMHDDILCCWIVDRYTR